MCDFRAGLVAALLLALSPLHVWYSQELRPYTLLVFWVLISSLILLQCDKKSWRLWLPIQFAVNALLVYTHLFAFLVLAPQALYILLKRGWRHCVLWSLVHGILVGGIGFAALNLPHFSLYPSFGPNIPTVGEFFLDLISKDINSRYRIPTTMADSMSPLPSGLEGLSVLQPWCDGMLILVVTGICCICLYGFLRALFIPSRRTSDEDEDVSAASEKEGVVPDSQIICSVTGHECRHGVPLPDGKDSLYFVMVLCLPSAFLVASQVILDLPFYSVGYDLYSTLGLYLILGIGVSVSGKTMRVILTSALLGLYAYQALMLLPRTTRPAWDLAAQYVKEEGSKKDLILDETVVAPVSRCQPYFESSSLPMVPVCSYREALDKAAGFLSNQRNTDPVKRGEGVSVWLITELSFVRLDFPANVEPLELLQAGIAEYALEGNVKMFPGGTELAVVRIRLKADKEPVVPRPFPSSLPIEDAETILARLDSVNVEGDRRQEVLAALQSAIGLWPPLFIHAYFEHIGALVVAGEPEIAEAYGRSVILEFPRFGQAYFGVGMALAVRGERQKALPFFRYAFSCYPALEDAFGPFVAALCIRGDGKLTPEEISRMESFPFPYYGITARYVLDKYVSLEGGSSSIVREMSGGGLGEFLCDFRKRGAEDDGNSRCQRGRHIRPVDFGRYATFTTSGKLG